MTLGRGGDKATGQNGQFRSSFHFGPSLPPGSTDGLCSLFYSDAFLPVSLDKLLCCGDLAETGGRVGDSYNAIK